MREPEYEEKLPPVSMADEWFTFVSADHFWIKWRLDALRRHRGLLPSKGERVLEVGCGNGVFLKQLHTAFGLDPIGCDLNPLTEEFARKSPFPIHYQDILLHREDWRAAFPAIFLMDVVEHIEDDSAFLSALHFYLKPGGILVLNVPALPVLYSVYDRRAGHVRRYNRRMLTECLNRAGFRVTRMATWGFSMIPLLLLRKWMLTRSADEEIIERGFVPPSRAAEWALNVLRRIESAMPISDTGFGTSLLAFASRADD